MKFLEKSLLSLSLAAIFLAITAIYLAGWSLVDFGYLSYDATGGKIPSTGAFSANAPLSKLVGPGFLFRERIVEIVVFWWVFFFGAAIGSFLNVVVWRMPRGKTIVWKGSFCPRCKVDIRFRDNIPIAGWWMLRGKCRGCQLPISVRYPLVELITGLQVLVLFLFSTQSKGLIYPTVPYSLTGWHLWLLDPFFAASATLPLYHVFLLAIFITAWWIRIDGTKFPVKLAVIGAVFGLLYPALLEFSSPIFSYFELKISPVSRSFLFFPEMNSFGSGEAVNKIRLGASVASSSLAWNWLTTLGYQFCFGLVGGVVGAAVSWLLKMTVKKAEGLDFPREQSEVDSAEEKLLGQDVQGPPNGWEIAAFYGLVGIYGSGSLLLGFVIIHLVFSMLMKFCLPPAHRLFFRTAWMVLPFAFLTSLFTWRIWFDIISQLSEWFGA